ncbi:hypothetical protein LBMAG56_45210 [Verrucomicrobiota bacterium]|nr:hypothetical protein LBMAG56_45210 [Verrucomicrobiota bacterium]
MSDDNFSEVSTQSWFSRIADSIKGMLFGGILAAVAVVVLFWNEGRAVNRAQALKEGAGAVVAASAERVDPANDGKLVHLSSLATTTETLADTEFGIATNALKLRRNAEMYQWKETKSQSKEKNLGGSETTKTTFNYTKQWSESLIDSAQFKQREGHTNPAAMPYSARTSTAEKITVGAYTLSGALSGMINNFTELPLEQTENLPAPVKAKAKLQDRRVFLGADPGSPQIGDQRIGFQIARPAVVSLVARQVKGTFEPYTTKNGGKILLLQVGEFSATAMFQRAEAENAWLTWALRLGGFIAMWIGFALIAKPLAVLGDIVPFIGTVIEFGIGLIAMLFAGVISLVTVAVAWIVYRPVLGVTLLVAAIALPFLVKRMRGAAKPAGQR